jgi:hypothetical protein
MEIWEVVGFSDGPKLNRQLEPQCQALSNCSATCQAEPEAADEIDFPCHLVILFESSECWECHWEWSIEDAAAALFGVRWKNDP